MPVDDVTKLDCEVMVVGAGPTCLTYDLLQQEHRARYLIARMIYVGWRSAGLGVGGCSRFLAHFGIR